MRVSFVIPSFNSAAWLPHAFISVSRQTHKEVEVVIVDDCSTDTTQVYTDWLKTQGHKNLIIHRNEENKGRSYSRNKGNELATGEIVCVLDADDLANDKRAELTVKKLKSGYDVVYGSALFMNALGYRVREAFAKEFNAKDIIRPLDMEKWDEDVNAGDIPDFREFGIVHSSVGMWRKHALKYPYSAGKISDLGIDDWEQQIRMIKDGLKFGVIHDTICGYRAFESNITHKRDIKEVMKAKSEILAGVRA